MRATDRNGTSIIEALVAFVLLAGAALLFASAFGAAAALRRTAEADREASRVVRNMIAMLGARSCAAPDTAALDQFRHGQSSWNARREHSRWVVTDTVVLRTGPNRGRVAALESVVPCAAA
ncbi:MAG: hypothetical protein FJ202_12140 [Gemmatimonadetes bacterium]|nr:hypothetical protein [Gemmatimonadota bacterium]